MRRVSICAVLFLAAMSARAAMPDGCHADATPLLILGTFHMEGSSADSVNPAPVDMSTARRQAEIEALVGQLADFRPTRVAVESSRISNYWNDRYAAWRKSREPLGYNEIEQVGFRLADRAGLAKLSPVDYPMWMDGTTAAERHEPPPRPASAETEGESPLLRAVRAQVAADDRVLEEGTVSDLLWHLNRPERTVMNQRWDVISNLEPGEGTALYEKTDRATNWYKRNLRIYTNLAAISGPGERVVLLIGAGHAHVLNGLAAADPRFCPVPASDFLAGLRRIR